ncbi:MAG TPA: glutamate-1-semialdehyde-2,1-aminomutase [Cryomorphaceae bacterium]|nr:glutamate-1-semialdehyde-2,1-aminomutase [Owenweeksia sp.]MBG00256.1 glutamate-1-semialdehyde-2,1-aminomutase [Owenweeksia sp.]HAD97988.1 glutamate-1-semialdehyde-2,1-aminomutase [Cryomorphaceae bacterium]|tara:strand:+ start:18547 stop:19836 length:1290 start_codon:yes stop_codon:yes gene_type:complete
MNTTRSKSLFQTASKYIPGGVNSPVRAFKSVGGDPIFIQKAKGAYMYDEDGNRFIDYIASWGPMIMGHAFEPVVKAIQERVENSTSFGAPTELEIQLAQLICESIPNVDRVRMVNSGTEATMSAIRLARGFTGKEKVIKFAGCYHGHGDSFLIKAGSGAVTLGHPSSPGVTKGTAKDTLLAEYNDLLGVKELVEANKGEIAALIIEPIPGNMGCILPEEGFLEGLREICTQENIILIFDEVMTGFRLGFGGAQQALGIEADLVTYGKVIGAGMPVGAYAGREDIMEFIAPNGPVYQAGTLSGNPIAMVAGLTLLQYLKDHPQVYDELDQKCHTIQNGLESILPETGLPWTINRKGSMISLHFTNESVRDFDSAGKGANEHFKKFFHGMLKRGVYLPPSAYESWFLSHPLSKEDIEHTLESARLTFREMQ